MMEYKLTDRFKNAENYISRLQNIICKSLEEADGKFFSSDKWERKEGGGGITRIIQNGKLFEKGAVNISSVYGLLPEEAAAPLKVKPQNFAACGLSLIIHPYSPEIPTVHMNIRYIELSEGRSWFGGGTDLTPYFPNTEDFKYFHNVLKEACNSVIPGSYKDFKRQCDEYFTLKHRNEMRGIGGVFFDYLNGEDEKNLSLIKSLGDSFLKSYLPVVEKRRNKQFTEDDKKFQLVRRGRYVEFNLLYDRGTLFGLRTGGRIESILASLPPEVNFIYNFKPQPGSPHEEMTGYYQPKEWADI